MKPVFLSHYKRTAFSRAHSKKPEIDAFSQIRGDSMLSQLIDQYLDDSNIAPQAIDDLTIGCALPVKDQWSFGGRYPIMQSKLGDQCASRSIDQQCGSGLAAMRCASMLIASGAADIALAGGYENMTRIPMGPYLFKQEILTVPANCQTHYDLQLALHMGLTAENLLSQSGITRQALDEFAFRSHQRASRARQSGFFAGEIQAIQTATLLFDQDANIRSDTKIEKLAELKPAFCEDGQITAGNSSPLTSGAALTVMMSEAALKAHNAKPISRIIACIDRGVRPEIMGSAVVPAVERLLATSGLTVADIDFWEINEAFSIVPLYAIQQLNIDPTIVNVHGGALAIGHPLGASGIRLAGTLSRTLVAKKGKYGVAAACIGGGQGIAMLVERV
jgi:acetyl-CoA C-acetyltransferase